MGRIEKTVFISYRRANFWTALAIYQNLTTHGYDVFFDYKSIPSGDFGKVITENIKYRAHFLVVLSPSALERCNEPGDWLRREIEIAIDSQRNIIPLTMKDFDFGSTTTKKILIGKLGKLKKFNAMSIPAEYFEEAMDKLRSNRFLNRPLESISHPVSEITNRITEEQISAAKEAAPIDQKQLTAQEWFERGYVFAVESNNYDEAIRCFSEAITLQRNYANAYFNRGKARKAKGDQEGAIKDYDIVIRLQPDDAEAYNNRGILRRTKGDLDGAIQDFDKAIRLQSNYAEAYNNRGNVHRTKGDLDRAIQDYDEAISLQPNYTQAIYNRGYVYQTKGDTDRAIKNYQESLQIKPNDNHARISLFSLLKKLGKNTQADEHEKLARELVTKENEYNQACFEAICGNIEKALDLLKIAMEKGQSTKEWAKKDPDFENLRDEPRFKEIVGN